MTQTAEILDYMIHVGEITPMDALKHCGCMRLGARIWDLRHTFMVDIKTRTATVKTARGTADVAAYSVVNKKDAQKVLKRLQKVS